MLYSFIDSVPGFVQILEKLEVLEFNVEIFKALKPLDNDHRYGKVWKNP